MTYSESQWPHGHKWEPLGLEDTSDWAPELRVWARTRWSCMLCYSESLVFGHLPTSIGEDGFRPGWCSYDLNGRKVAEEPLPTTVEEQEMKKLEEFATRNQYALTKAFIVLLVPLAVALTVFATLVGGLTGAAAGTLGGGGTAGLAIAFAYVCERTLG